MGCICGKNGQTQQIKNHNSEHLDKSTNANGQQAHKNFFSKKSSRLRKIKETVTIKENTNEDGHKMINNYIFLETLGRGSFGKVKLAEKEINGVVKKFAIKIMKKSFLLRQRSYQKGKDGKMFVKNALEDVQREIAIMKKIDHKNVVTLFEVIENPEKDKIYIVMQFCGGGQLIEWDEDEARFYIVNKSLEGQELSEIFLRKIFRDLIDGLHYLHTHNIVHRDIKPQNVLLDENENALFVDFGISKMIGLDKNNENSQYLMTSALGNGTIQFLAPEEIRDNDPYSGYEADVWALGITFFSFIYLEIPFYSDSPVQLFKKIKEDKVKFPDTRQVSPELKNIILKMLEKDSKKRATLQEIATEPWINEGYPVTLDQQMKQEPISEPAEEEMNEVYHIAQIVKIKSMARKWIQRAEQRLHSKAESHFKDSSVINNEDSRHDVINLEVKDNNTKFTKFDSSV